MSSRLGGTSGVVVAALIAAAGIAGAQPDPSQPPPPPPPGGAMQPPMPVMMPPPPPERHGLFAGGGLWGGNISCNGQDCGGFREAGGINGQIGWLFTPRLGVMLDVWAMTSKQNDVGITFVTATVNLRYWLAPVVWIQAGAGNGHAVISYLGFAARGDDVPVGELAAGLEVVRGRTWALDVQAKVAQGTATSDNGSVTTGRSVGVGAGFTWFSR